MNLSIVILAAGAGTRMRSDLPKVLHCLAAKPLLAHVVETAQSLSENVCVVYGHKGEMVKQTLAYLDTSWAEQKEQLGTGHAVKVALPELSESDRVLVLYGDGPLISKNTLERLLNQTADNEIGWLTAIEKDPTGLGRIVRSASGEAVAIVEEKDATEEQKTINEINTGICLFPTRFLQEALPKLSNNNQQGEYYLTDLFAMAIAKGIKVNTVLPSSLMEVKGVNNKQQLAELERAYQWQQAQQLLEQGVTLLDPARFDLRGRVVVGRDVIIDVNVVLEGCVTIGSNCRIGPNCVLKNVKLADGVVIEANSILEDCSLANHCQVGPFARLRPGAELAESAKVGNFVEIKKSKIGKGSKVNHLAYIGDAELGQAVNIGAGTITCNYDGANKHKTVIGDHAFIGTNNSLVAPLTIGEGATTGAGSTISKNVEQGVLAVARAKQATITNWQRPVKEKK